MSVEWRNGDGRDAIILINSASEVISEVPGTDQTALKTYLGVTGDLDAWQKSLSWSPVDGERRDPRSWGNLVFSRADSGEVTYVDPELFWDGVYRWFRSRGVDYNT